MYKSKEKQIKSSQKKHLVTYLGLSTICCGCIATFMTCTFLLTFYSSVYNEDSFFATAFSWIATFFFLAALIQGILAFFIIVIQRLFAFKYLFIVIAITFSAFIIISFCFITFNIAKEQRGKVFTGVYQIEKLAKAINYYVVNNKGHLPLSENWCDSLLSGDNDLFERDFRLPRWYAAECNFAFNETLSGMNISNVNSETVLIIRVDGDWNQHGTGDTLEKKLAKVENPVVLLRDGRIVYYDPNNALAYTQNKIETLRWRP